MVDKRWVEIGIIGGITAIVTTMLQRYLKGGR